MSSHSYIGSTTIMYGVAFDRWPIDSPWRPASPFDPPLQPYAPVPWPVIPAASTEQVPTDLDVARAFTEAMVSQLRSIYEERIARLEERVARLEAEVAEGRRWT